MNTPESIVDLPADCVFVFGSNLAGNHAGGAARLALEKFGAVSGVGKGLVGRSYAFPTLDWDMGRLSHNELAIQRNVLYVTAVCHPELTFYLTRVGCGIAGYPEEDMKSLFKVHLSNIVYPEGW